MSFEMQKTDDGVRFQIDDDIWHNNEWDFAIHLANEILEKIEATTDDEIEFEWEYRLYTMSKEEATAFKDKFFQLKKQWNK